MSPKVYNDISSSIQVTLLPRSAYCARDNPTLASLGIALERQTGVHAIGSDKRRDFDTWAGALAYTPPGVDVFSESTEGGEYLVLRWRDDEENGDSPSRRLERVAPPAVMRQALMLRRAMFGEDQAAVRALVQQLLCLIEHWTGEESVHSTHSALQLIYRQVLQRIERDLGAPDKDFSLATLSAMVRRSPLRFLREFKQLTGMTPHAYVIERRLQRARRDCLDTALPLSQVAAEAGYASQSHMGLAFRKMLACSPGEYREILESAVHHRGRTATVLLR